MRNKSGFLNKSSICLFAIISVILFTGIKLVMLLKVDDVTKRVNAEEEIVCLINLTHDKELLFSDLFIFNPKTGKSAVLDIPVNYGSIIDSINRMDRIDVLYRKDRPEQFIRKIEVETNLDIPFYFDFDMRELAACADLMGGLEMTLEKSDYPYLPEGRAVLDGDKVIEYMEQSLRNTSSEEMAEAGYKLIRSFIQGLGHNEAYLCSKTVLPVLRENMDTNMNSGSLASFIFEMGKADNDRMIFHHVRGDRKIIEGKVILFPYYNGNIMRQWLGQTRKSLADIGIFDEADASDSLEILNGTTVGGLAARTSATYRNLGYNVKSVKNAMKNDYGRTCIIGHRNNLASVQKVASIIQCRNIVYVEDNPREIAAEELILKEKDIILILGKDFNGGICK